MFTAEVTQSLSVTAPEATMTFDEFLEGAKQDPDTWTRATFGNYIPSIPDTASRTAPTSSNDTSTTRAKARKSGAIPISTKERKAERAQEGRQNQSELFTKLGNLAVLIQGSHRFDRRKKDIDELNNLLEQAIKWRANEGENEAVLFIHAPYLAVSAMDEEPPTFGSTTLEGFARQRQGE
jgi:hypothetical protein